ncbi:MAG: beta-lactamase family protein [Saprospiraceae bacterium]|nr:beta-lactamase family protein [Saprospiraceae bacterium]
MNKIKFFILTLFTGSLIFGNTLGLRAQSISHSMLDRLDSLVETSMKNYQIPGMVLGIIDGQELVKLSPYGFVDLQFAVPTNDSTVFELASLSKQFTAAAIILLQQRGELSLDDNLSKYLPNCPKNWESIKIKHLLWHTSGLPGMFPRDSFTNQAFTGYAKMSSVELDAMMQVNNVSKEMALKSILTDELDFEPGEKHHYSDVGYLLLGLVVDTVAGNYRSFLEKELFQPSGMTHTYILDQEKIFQNQSRGYSLKNGEWINIQRTWDYEIPSFFGVFSNVVDLYKWHQALFSDQLFTKESRDLLFSQGYLNDGTRVNYGGGWNVEQVNGVRYIYHGGVTGVIWIMLPDYGVSVIALTNLGYNGNDYVRSLMMGTDIVRFLGMEELANRNHISSNGAKVIKTKKKALKQIIGNYITLGEITAKVYLEDGVPIFDCPAQGMKSELALLDNGKWLLLGVSMEYILEYDAVKAELRSNLFRTFKKIESTKTE